MKKRLLFIHNEDGFFLPYVLFVTTIILLVLSTNINTYKNDINISANHIQQLEIATLVQMGREKFKNEILLLPIEEGSVTYTFPTGKTKITYVPLDNAYHLLITVSIGNKIYRNINTVPYTRTKTE